MRLVESKGDHGRDRRTVPKRAQNPQRHELLAGSLVAARLLDKRTIGKALDQRRCRALRGSDQLEQSDAPLHVKELSAFAPRMTANIVSLAPKLPVGLHPALIANRKMPTASLSRNQQLVALAIDKLGRFGLDSQCDRFIGRERKGHSGTLPEYHPGISGAVALTKRYFGQRMLAQGGDDRGD